MTIKICPQRLKDNFLFATLSGFFLYALFYQYAFSPIPGALSTFAILIFISSFSKLKISFSFYNPLIGIFIFTLYLIAIGGFFAFDKQVTFYLLISHIEFMIPLFGIYIYSAGNYKKLQNLLLVIWIATTLIAFAAVNCGTTTTTGAITVGTTNTLNVNVLSSFLTMGVFSGLVLLSTDNCSRLKKTIVIIGMGLQFVAQINGASRRGIVVLLFILVAGFYTIVEVQYKRKPIVKVMFYFMVIFGIIIVVNAIVKKPDTLLLLERFRNTGYLGDALRRVYQEKAMELFFDNPLFGQGMGAVGAYAGMYSHSLYYELLACTGILGLLLFFGTVLGNNLVLYYKASKKATIDKQYELLARLMGIFIISILIGGIAVVYIYDMYFYIMLGLTFSASKTLKDVQQNEMYKRFANHHYIQQEA